MTRTLLVFFIFLQVTDGLFTLHGINTVGLDYEGNPLLLYGMRRLGVVEILAITKLAAIFMGFMLYKFKAETIGLTLWLFYGVLIVYSINFIRQVSIFFQNHSLIAVFFNFIY